MNWTPPDKRTQILDDVGYQSTFKDGSWIMAFSDGRLVCGNAEGSVVVRLPAGASQTAQSCYAMAQRTV